MRKKLPFLCFIAGLSLVAPRVLQAHEDTVLVQKEGRLIGLPDKYCPAKFDANSGTLRIAAREVTLPPFLMSLFHEHPGSDYVIMSSWYHDPSPVSGSGLPPYISFRLGPGARDYGYRILVDMDTLKLIELTVVLKISERSTRYLDVELDEDTKRDMRDSIRAVKEGDSKQNPAGGSLKAAPAE